MGYKYDIFLSHNSIDKPWTEKLAMDIENNQYGNLNVFLDKWDIAPGENILMALEQGLKSSRYLGLVMSPEAFKSGWVVAERTAAQFIGVQSNRNNIIPILLRKCEIPPFLVGINYIDFSSDEEYESSLEKLLCVLLGKKLPRGSQVSADQYNINWDRNIFSDYIALFQRPAFSISCIDELSLYELSQAIDDVMAAINTGRLYSRSGNLLKEVEPINQFKTNRYKDEIKQITKLLYNLKIKVNQLSSQFEREMNISKYYFSCSPQDQIMIGNLDTIENLECRKHCISLMDEIDIARNNILEIVNTLLGDKEFELIKVSSKLINENSYLKDRVFRL